jgi:hypothetical protein
MIMGSTEIALPSNSRITTVPSEPSVGRMIDERMEDEGLGYFGFDLDPSSGILDDTTIPESRSVLKDKNMNGTVNGPVIRSVSGPVIKPTERSQTGSKGGAGSETGSPCSLTVLHAKRGGGNENKVRFITPTTQSEEKKPPPTWAEIAR